MQKVKKIFILFSPMACKLQSAAMYIAILIMLGIYISVYVMKPKKMGENGKILVLGLNFIYAN